MYFSTDPSGTIYAGLEVEFIFQLERGKIDLRQQDDEEGELLHQFQILDSNDEPVLLDGTEQSVVKRMDDKDFARFNVIFTEPGRYRLQYRALERWEDEKADEVQLPYDPLATIPVVDPAVLRVALVPAGAASSPQADLWTFIDQVSRNLRFDKFMQFVKDRGAAPLPQAISGGAGGRSPSPAQQAAAVLNSEYFQGYGTLSYSTLHGLAAEFVTRASLGQEYRNTGWNAERTRERALQLSYVEGERADLAKPLPDERTYPLQQVPFVELIFNYWMEEAMLFQALNHIVARFQNRRTADGRTPLTRLNANPLLPLRGLIYGLAEAERERLSVRRRSAEYQYEYGLQLIGRAIPAIDQMVERRTQFLEAFHSLLHATYRYYKEHDDKTIEADPFPLLSSLQELHLVLARGAHNQFADLPLTARIETLDVQWMLAQPEMREFLGGPTMIPYEEPWMDRVDTMKSIQGWSDVSVTHFYDLAVHGEQLLLSVRHGRWNESSRSSHDAENWALHWRNSVQRYIHAYRVVTGADLAERVDATMPSRLLAQRLTQRVGRA